LICDYHCDYCYYYYCCCCCCCCYSQFSTFLCRFDDVKNDRTPKSTSNLFKRCFLNPKHHFIFCYLQNKLRNQIGVWVCMEKVCKGNCYIQMREVYVGNRVSLESLVIEESLESTVTSVRSLSMTLENQTWG
jgi:hypothetical protein